MRIKKRGAAYHRAPLYGKSFLRRHAPKLRLQVQLKHTLNQDHYVVAEYLAQRLVYLRRAGLASQAIPELRLNHAHLGFAL